MDNTCLGNIDIDKEIKKTLKRKEILFFISTMDVFDILLSHNLSIDQNIMLLLAFIYNICNQYEISNEIIEEEEELEEEELEEEELEEAIDKEITDDLEIDKMIDNMLDDININNNSKKLDIENITCKCHVCSKINESIENYKTLSLEDPTVLKIKNIIDKIIKKLNIEINI